MSGTIVSARTSRSEPPDFIDPQLTKLVEFAPDGDQWAHEIKFDGYRLHARIVGKAARLLTRTGLDWTHRYQSIATAQLMEQPSLTFTVDPGR